MSGMGVPTAAGQSRVDATARAVIESAADAIVAFSTDRSVLLWNPAAERMFGWPAAEVLGLAPPIIPEELQAEHNAVLERVRGGGQLSFVTRRTRSDGSLIDLRIDISALTGRGGEMLGWVNVCHPTDEDDEARYYIAQRARVVRRLGDVVADMNAQRDLESVLDRIAASLRELTGADAGGFVLIEDDKLRLVSMDGLPASLRGRTADLESQPGRRADELRPDGDDGHRRVRWLRRPHLVRAARPAHDHAQPVARGRPALRRRCTRCTAAGRSGTSSWSSSS